MTSKVIDYIVYVEWDSEILDDQYLQETAKGVNQIKRRVAVALDLEEREIYMKTESSRRKEYIMSLI